jgi:stage V sporulation protein SpoVS
MPKANKKPTKSAGAVAAKLKRKGMSDKQAKALAAQAVKRGRPRKKK